MAPSGWIGRRPACPGSVMNLMAGRYYSQVFNGERRPTRAGAHRGPQLCDAAQMDLDCGKVKAQRARRRPTLLKIRGGATAPDDT